MAIKHSPIRRFESYNLGGWERDIGDWLGDRSTGGRQDDIGERPWLNVPLGSGAHPVGTSNVEQSSRVPSVVPISIPPPPPYVPPAIVGPPRPPDQTVVPTVSWSDYLAAGGVLPSDWNQYPHASDHPSLAAVAVVPQTQVTTENDVSILGDIYDIVDTSLGGILPGGVPWGGATPPPVSNLGLGGMSIAASGALAQPVLGAATVIPGTGGPVCAPTMIYNSKTGKWTKKRHRRRRQLATKSDIKDLSALIGVFGNGKALQSWIATHS